MTTSGQTRSRARHHQAIKRELTESADPVWVENMISNLRPDLTAVLDAPLFKATAYGAFPEGAWRRVLLEFFGVVESFPRYMGAYLARTSFGKRPGDILARDWLIGNIRTEALHAQWYIDWAGALGIAEDEILRYRPCAEVSALQEFLWSMAARGSLAEAFGAVNYAVEGATGEWTRLVAPAFRKRIGDDKYALMWLEEHAQYDEAHPREALELIKITARDETDQANTEAAVRTSLQLFRRGFDACFANPCS
jgi:pyrroloquinoline quinone (PQQ) biosynthesis protein C